MERWVLVTTEHRGVFFGRVVGDGASKAEIVLEECRCAIYWSGSRGFLGLASHGPEEGSRIGSTAPRVLLHDVTSVSDCTPKAVKVWRGWA
jgi:hypothetical protein